MTTEIVRIELMEVAARIGGWPALLLLLSVGVSTTNAQEARKFIEPTATRQGLLGFAASLSGDVGFAGAPAGIARPGLGYLFDLETGATRMTLEPSIQRADSLFGFNSQMVGNKLLVGDPGNPFAKSPIGGAAYVFDVSTGAELLRFTPDDSFAGDEFGFGINLYQDLAVVGAPHRGQGQGACLSF